jgi:acyl carrier protein
MSLDQFQKPLRPKVGGSWNLHYLLPDNLDFFVMLSSVAGLYGIHGQGNYAAGNTYQDALARYRVSIGQKAVSINLGAVADVGYMAETADVAEVHRKSGYRFFTSDNLLWVLETVCDPSWAPADPQASLIILGLSDPKSFLQAGRDVPEWLHRPSFQLLHKDGDEELIRTSGHAIAEINDRPNTKVLAQNALHEEAAAEIVAKGLQKKLSKALDMPETEIDMSKPFFTIGVDSLMAVELRFWFSRNLNQEIGVQDILSQGSMMSLCRRISERVRRAAPKVIQSII